VLLSIPRGGICDIGGWVGPGLGGKLGLRKANTGIGALVGADGTLACDTFVVSVTLTLAGLTVASALVGALDNGMGIVGVDNSADPGFGPVRGREKMKSDG
jgi:hypothetical protein